ncbi:MAG TPA: rod shape-determining protein MreC [Candidatus Hydrogenedentes bacterium]|nr:rod shape-determining protein MreC [Candidatus Hydrogenedentota bacterium]HIJ73077.1 rod shape-determining protein MreC [Candidatus Hydrogenedentota bacterium]
MNLARHIHESRSAVVLAILVALSLVSLASGKRATWVADGLRAAISVASYPFSKALKTVERAADYTTGLFVSYNGALEGNRALQKKLSAAMLRAADRAELAAENTRLRRMLRFERNQPKFCFEPVEVEVIGEFERKLQVDRGKKHGVREFMCAMTSDGVVGAVVDVQWLSSHVLTLHHAQCRIGAMIGRNRVRGIVRGSGSDVSRICTMEYIDINDDVRVGDIVVTSGERIFPRGIVIGTVLSVRSSNSLLKEADVMPAANPYALDELFLVQKAETPLDEVAGAALSEAMTPDSAMSRAYPMPDLRSVQERYAP